MNNHCKLTLICSKDLLQDEDDMIRMRERKREKERQRKVGYTEKR